ncbi:PTS glucose transporter subunit IIA [Streptomonospora nanhaiensis]|uniref:Glucose-specific phosphotransferase system IIA component n=1 Tax=Streptomonospora nanhaiensis TaxID=1323731 RepID=A0A853BLG0_9ACTN|nr:PTS glucose transporter subunit IIA [Streptomonospora nanhaiensis]MBV2362108.1 PTS glucose transporter subunit IIA [Streptomonospora nanhaiensis]MBV2364820.1 PTS glucose transporter subunit IIA [Streptomonospora nanhaiensis]MBX9388561.1 PTS glucose transporter subunit IIA [Streptomonospora nanhaiensis]NYI96063.1 glucose-specific phosphotransferase system IIA component [Streptomonospora nanhaiensis]
MLTVLTPVPGTAVAMSEVDDPVFAQGMVGPGVAVQPARHRHEAVAPIAGRIVKLHPHAFLVLGEGGRGVLVHLGIDTVKLDGAGFETLVEEGAAVEPGTSVIRWDPADVERQGLSPVVPVVALEADAAAVADPAAGEVAAGDTLFRWA